MRCLISSSYKIPVVIEGDEVVVYSVGFSSGVCSEIAREKKFAFVPIYNKIHDFLESKSGDYEVFEGDVISQILLHVEQYKNNLYGFYSKDNFVAPGDVLLLQMSYVEYFIAELSSFILSMGSDDLMNFEAALRDEIEGDVFYSERYYLNDIYKVLKCSG